MGGASGGYESKRSEAHLEGRALRERWPLTPKARAKILRRLLSIVKSPNATNRDLIGATRVLATLDGLNLEAERIEILRGATDPGSVARIIEEALARADGGGTPGPADPADPG